MRFFRTCFSSDCLPVSNVVKFGLCNCPATSLICSNALDCCLKYNTNIYNLCDGEFIDNISRNFYSVCGYTSIPGDVISGLLEAIFTRDGLFNLDNFLNWQQLQDIVSLICTA